MIGQGTEFRFDEEERQLERLLEQSPSPSTGGFRFDERRLRGDSCKTATKRHPSSDMKFSFESTPFLRSKLDETEEPAVLPEETSSISSYRSVMFSTQVVLGGE